ncbi:Pentatricopeptide repeat-containing protein [Apostasia shenzhenica]|uniref:Pentatricopeptide repeat-containing protein n=1 Tax=Apostasia shenzhenica TaxID=1088818 RepID=A0A2I0AVG6_9ASPA|nr:Pentatricopeptide repeat-containing protein [Apostasia shenzhenica]
MHGGCYPIERRLLRVLPRAVANHRSQSHFCSAAGDGSIDDDDDGDDYHPPWMSANHLFHRHPRLLFLEHCHSRSSLDLFLAYTIVAGLFRNAFVSSRILRCCVVLSAPDLSPAFSIFSQMNPPNIFSWNTMIKALSANSSEVLSLFVEMRQRGVPPDKYTIPFVLKSFTSISDFISGRSVHASSFVLGFESNPFVQTGLVTFYLNSRSMEDARQVFDEMPCRDLISWTAVISGLASQGLSEQALAVFCNMRIDDSSLVPNTATMVSAMAACSSLGSLNHTKAFHAFLEKSGFQTHIFTRNSLIDAYAKSGSIAHAGELFAEMHERDLHSWTAMISGLAMNGLGSDAIRLFSEMRKTRMTPDSTTMVAVLSACSHAGMVNEGLEIFRSMEGELGVRPELKHYGCVVDLLARSGRLPQAYEFLCSMPMEPNLEVLGALLNACSVHGDLELGELLSRRIDSAVRGAGGGAGVVLSNMYAYSGQWREVISIRKERKEEEGRKPPGRSWIEVRDAVHEFVPL